jgi:acyl-CoA oxidase
MTGIGCFALTELGYGNNAVEMETTAVYVSGSGKWVVQIPSDTPYSLTRSGK